MKKMTKAMLMTALILGSVHWGGTPVHANELDTFTLDEYVVTAARTETKLVDTPANISVVTAEQIESRHYTSVADALKDVPGANVLDGGTGTGEKAIFLNGDERVLVLVDGRRVSMDMGTMTGRASYDSNLLPDVSLIERIEVLKGSGGALYGSDAVGGVINVITKKGDRTYGKVSLAYGSNGAEDMNAMYSIKQGKTGVTVSAAKYKQDYYKYRDYASDTTKRWPCPSDYNSEKVSLNVTQELSEDSNITIGYDYSKFDGCNPGSMTWAATYWSPVEKETENIYLKYDWVLNERDQGYFQFYRNKYEYYNQGGMEETANGIDLQQAITVSDNNNLVVGASWRDADVFNENAYEKESNIENIALFVSDTWELFPSWTLNTGVRYDDHSEAGDETTFSAGLNKKFDDRSHAYINWGQVFKAPNADDLYYSWGGTYAADPNLKPETGEAWTIGYATDLGDRTSINVNYFENDLKDAIDWVRIDGINTSVNIDEQKKRGMELAVTHKINDNIDLNASYTYIRVENNDKNSGFVKDWNYMPNVYRVGVRYHEGKWDTNLWLRMGTGGATHQYAHTMYGYKQSYLDSSYVTVDMAVTYQATKDLKLFAKGYNLFNEAYAEQAGHYNGNAYDCPAQSRRFLIGAEYSF